MGRYNDEHYKDPTPEAALNRISKAERVDAVGRLKSVFWHCERIAREYGIELVGKIKGKDSKSGRTFTYGRDGHEGQRIDNH